MGECTVCVRLFRAFDLILQNKLLQFTHERERRQRKMIQRAGVLL